jgi:hypothetical protein
MFELRKLHGLTGELCPAFRKRNRFRNVTQSEKNPERKNKKTTKLLEISVFITGVFDSPNSSKFQLVMAGTKNI